MIRLVRLGSALAVAGAVHAAVNARLLRRPGLPGTARASVLIPARNEADHISDCLTALRDQEIVEILVLDDGSTDDTAALVQRAAVADPRIRLIRGAELPTGWLGKPFACQQLSDAADPTSTVLVFLDADVRLEPGAVAAATGILERTGLDLVSPHPRQLAFSPAERLLQPLLQWSWLTTLPLRLAERSSRPSLGAANGQFLLIERGTYVRAGRHTAVKADVLEDLALLRAVKASGGRGGVVDGSALASCRMYTNWGEVRDGYGKSLWAAFGSTPGAAAVVGVLGLAYLVPATAALRGSRIGLVGYAAGVAGRVITARASGGRAWPDALAHPASIGAFGYLTGRSILMHQRGLLSWKSRPLS